MNQERIVIGVDDSDMVDAEKRANARLDNTEKRAARSADASTRAAGTASQSMTAMAERAVSSLERISKTVIGGLTGAVEKALLVATAIGATAAASAAAVPQVVAHARAWDILANSYRAVRLALSPTIFTAAQLAISALAIESVRLAAETGRVTQAQAFQSQRTGLQIKELQELALAERAAGLAGGTLLGMIQSLQSHTADGAGKGLLAAMGIDAGAEPSHVLRNIAAAMGEIEDPTEKARKAVILFGDDAEKYLPLLNSHLDDSIARFNALGAVMGEKFGRQSSQFLDDARKLRDGLSETFGDPLAGIGALVTKWLSIGGATIGSGLIGAIELQFLPVGPARLGKQISQSEREMRQRDDFSREDWVDFAASDPGLAVPTARGLAQSQIDRLQQFQKVAPGLAKAMGFDERIAAAQRVTNPLAAFAPPDEIEKLRQPDTIESIGARISSLAQQREQKMTDAEGASTTDRGIASQSIRNLDRQMAGLTATQKRLEDAQKAAEDAKRALAGFESTAASLHQEVLEQTASVQGGPLALLDLLAAQDLDRGRALNASPALLAQIAADNAAKRDFEHHKILDDFGPGQDGRAAMKSLADAWGDRQRMWGPSVSTGVDMDELRRQGEIFKAQPEIAGIDIDSQRSNLNLQAQHALRMSQAANGGDTLAAIREAGAVRLQLASQSAASSRRASTKKTTVRRK